MTKIKPIVPLIWAERPAVSPDGRYLIFYTNRNVVSLKDGSGQMWVKDLKDYTEKAVYTGGYEFVGWGNDGQVFIHDDDKLVGIDLKTLEAKVLREAVTLTSIVSYPYLVLPTRGQIAIENLESNKSEVLTDGVGRADMIVADPTQTNLAILNLPNPESFDNNILVIKNNNASDVRTIWPEEGYIFDTYSWIDQVNLLVVALKKATTDQVSYVVNVNED
ncbi:hypothetical protein [Paenibacillus sp. GCM10027626]|uniref:hypothetical protein n=1 Tax=Paenibacillus sp. GCM10027626 TaxID=3273411 RepID=UPI003628374F